MVRKNDDKEVSGGQGVRIFGRAVRQNPRDSRPDAALLAAGDDPLPVRRPGLPDDEVPSQTERLVLAPGGAARIAGAEVLTLVIADLEAIAQGLDPATPLFADPEALYTCPRPCQWKPSATTEMLAGAFANDQIGVHFDFGPDGELRHLHWLHRRALDVLASERPGKVIELTRGRAALPGKPWYIGGHPMIAESPPGDATPHVQPPESPTRPGAARVRRRETLP
jgi:hypothetical protein